MIRHVVVTYESEDGALFDDFDSCLAHEMKYLYDNCGVRFIHKNGKPIKDVKFDDDKVYNEAYGVTIDRNRQKENERFIDAIISNYGWILMDELKKSDATKYKFSQNELTAVK